MYLYAFWYRKYQCFNQSIINLTLPIIKKDNNTIVRLGIVGFSYFWIHTLKLNEIFDKRIIT